MIDLTVKSKIHYTIRYISPGTFLKCNCFLLIAVKIAPKYWILIFLEYRGFHGIYCSGLICNTSWIKFYLFSYIFSISCLFQKYTHRHTYRAGDYKKHEAIVFHPIPSSWWQQCTELVWDFLKCKRGTCASPCLQETLRANVLYLYHLSWIAEIENMLAFTILKTMSAMWCFRW